MLFTLSPARMEGFPIRKEFSKQKEEDTRAYRNNVFFADMNDAAGLYCSENLVFLF